MPRQITKLRREMQRVAQKCQRYPAEKLMWRGQLTPLVWMFGLYKCFLKSLKQWMKASDGKWLKKGLEVVGVVPVVGDMLIQPPKRPLGVAEALKVTEELPVLVSTMV